MRAWPQAAAYVMDSNRLIGRLTEHMAELEARLRGGAGYFTVKDRRISTLERLLEHWKTLYRLSESEVSSLKRSWSYRVGRAIVFPASLVKRAVARLEGKLAGRVPASHGSLAEPARLEQRAEWAAKYRRLQNRPVISIVLPVYNTQPQCLRQTLESVLDQVYQEWELCIADDGSTNQGTVEVLREFASLDSKRIKLELLGSNRGIASASNAAAGLATGEFLAFLDHDDLLPPDALLEAVRRIEQFPDADFLYSDEDKLGRRGRFVEPFHKPDFSPELLLTNNYLCHLSVIRTSVFRKVGGFREGFDGSQDYDLFLRVSEVARRIEHIPRILYHWRKTPGSAASSVRAKGGPWRESSRKALRAAIERRAWDADVEDGIVPGTYRVKFAVNPADRVSIIIPTRDRVDLLKRCIDSILTHTRHPEYEILVVSNNSVEEETYRYLEQAQAEGVLRFLRHDVPFNFSEINNFAARACDAPYLLFLNNDNEVQNDGWLRSILEFAQQKPVGAVGAKLLYPDRTIQHAGVVLGLMGVAGHSHRGVPEDQHGYFGQADVIRNYSAVTGACLLTRRDVFEQVGGFSEELAVAFNDVDFCLKVRQAGYRIVYTPYARLCHHESSSRERDDLSGTKTRFFWEIASVLGKWGDQLDADPCYNPNLTRWREDFGLKTPDEERKTREFSAMFAAAPKQAPPAAIACNEEPAEWRAGAASAGPETWTGADCEPRAHYKSVWDKLSATERRAKMNVMGSIDERHFIDGARETLSALESSVRVKPDDVVLEIGCGIGRVGKLLAPLCRKWIGCDVSGNMLKYAAQRLSPFDNVQLVEVSGFDLRPITDSSVDLVYCTIVFMHLDEWDRYGYVLEALRVLRPGGRFYIDNVNLLSDEGWSVFEAHRSLPPVQRPSHISKTSTPQEIEAYLHRANFRNVRCRESGPWVQCWAVK